MASTGETSRRAIRRASSPASSRLINVGLGRASAYSHTDADAGEIGARVSNNLALLDQVIQHSGIDDGDVEGLTGLDLPFERAAQPELDHDLVACRPLRCWVQSRKSWTKRLLA